jgi:anion-transporting  ArsA/GET3 family ATPase
VGPIRSQADNVMGLLHSQRTRVHLVTILEDMPVQETADGIAELRREGLPVGGVVVNLVRPRDLDDGTVASIREEQVDPSGLVAELKSAGVDADDDLVDGLLAEAADHAERRELEDTQRALVEALDAPTYELPRLAAGVDLGGLYELAASLKAQGLG